MLGLKSILAGSGVGLVAIVGAYFIGSSNGYSKGQKFEQGVIAKRILDGEILKKADFNKQIKDVNDHNQELMLELSEERQKNTDLNEGFRDERQQYLARIKQLAGKVGEYVSNECDDDGTYGFSRDFIIGVFNPIASGANSDAGRSTNRRTAEVGASSTPAPIGIRPIVSTNSADSSGPR